MNFHKESNYNILKEITEIIVCVTSWQYQSQINGVQEYIIFKHYNGHQEFLDLMVANRFGQCYPNINKMDDH